MHSSPLGYQVWAIAIYILRANLKSISSMKLHRDLGITQKSAWHLAHRIRETWKKDNHSFFGPVEADATYVGGKESNKHVSKKLNAGRGTVGRIPVAGIKDRTTNKVMAKVVEDAGKSTLQGFVRSNTQTGATVYTDESRSYHGLAAMYRHEAVNHSVDEFVHKQAHTNGVESFWSLLKRGYHGTFHHVSEKHLDRYVNEVAGRHNQRPEDTEDQMSIVSAGLDGKRLPYTELTKQKDLVA